MFGLPLMLPALLGGGKGIGSLLGKLFGKGGIDPTAALFGGLGMLGGGDEGPQFKSFRGTGGQADPVDALHQAMSMLYRLGAGLENKPPINLRSSYVQPGPAPVNIPGIPFQIGGGMGRDPAIDNPDLLSLGMGDMMAWQPFQGIAQNQWKDAGFDVSGTRPVPKTAQPAGGGARQPARRRRPA